MPENKEYMTHQEELGTIQISEEVVASIASAAVQEVPDVTGLMGANVSDFMGGKKMTAKGVRVEMDGEAIVVYVFNHGALRLHHRRGGQEGAECRVSGAGEHHRLSGIRRECPRGRHQLQLNEKEREEYDTQYRP